MSILKSDSLYGIYPAADCNTVLSKNEPSLYNHNVQICIMVIVFGIILQSNA